MLKNITNFFKKLSKKEKQKDSSNTAKERLHLVLMQDRANVSADFLELMRKEIIEVIKKYIDIDEKAIDVKLTNKMNEDGTVGAPALYANIPIITIKNEARKIEEKNIENNNKKQANRDNKNKVQTNKKTEEQDETEKQKEETNSKEGVKEEKTDKQDGEEEKNTKEQEDKKQKIEINS